MTKGRIIGLIFSILFCKCNFFFSRDIIKEIVLNSCYHKKVAEIEKFEKPNGRFTEGRKTKRPNPKWPIIENAKNRLKNSEFEKNEAESTSCSTKVTI